MLTHDTETSKVILFRNVLLISSTPERFMELYDIFLETLISKFGKADAKDHQLMTISDEYLIYDYKMGVVDKMSYWENTKYGIFTVAASKLDQAIIITKAISN